jgi:L-lactate dehydrogenase (cytochrome)
VFYQLYLMGGGAAAEAAIERARAAGFAGLVVTIDTPVSGIRERDYRNGMKELLSGNVLEKLRYLPQVLSRPGWLVGFLLDGGLRPLPNVILPGKGPMTLVDVNAALASSAVTWTDLRWIRDCWRGPIVVKGILTGDDARRAVDEGAAAISVSNHDGWQLDGVPAAVRALPEVVAAVNGQVEVLIDGGIRPMGRKAAKKLATGQCAFLSMNDSVYGELVANKAVEGKDFGYVPYPGTSGAELLSVHPFPPSIVPTLPSPRGGNGVDTSPHQHLVPQDPRALGRTPRRPTREEEEHDNIRARSTKASCPLACP